MRGIAAAWAAAFGEDVKDPEEWAQRLADIPATTAHTEAFSFNRPSLGVQETFGWAREFHTIRDAPHVAVFQVEFEREQLIGRQATEALRQPGDSWPPEDPEHAGAVAAAVEDVAGRLKA